MKWSRIVVVLFAVGCVSFGWGQSANITISGAVTGGSVSNSYTITYSHYSGGYHYGTWAVVATSHAYAAGITGQLIMSLAGASSGTTGGPDGRYTTGSGTWQIGSEGTYPKTIKVKMSQGLIEAHGWYGLPTGDYYSSVITITAAGVVSGGDGPLPDPGIDLPVKTYSEEIFDFYNPYPMEIQLRITDEAGNLSETLFLAPGERWIGRITSVDGQGAKVWLFVPNAESDGDGNIRPSTSNDYHEQILVLGSADFDTATPSSGTAGGVTPVEMPKSSTETPLAPGTTQGAQEVIRPKSSVYWTATATGALEVDEYREGVEAQVESDAKNTQKIVDAINSSAAASTPPVPSEWSDANKEDTAEDKVTTAAAYGSSAIGAPSGWGVGAPGVSGAGSIPSVTMPLPQGSQSFSFFADLPASVRGLASTASNLILLAAALALVRQCMATMRAYLVGLGAIQGAGASVVNGPETIGPGVGQAKAAAIALGTTLAIAAAWAAMAVLLNALVTPHLGGSFGLPSEIGVVTSFVPVVALLTMFVGGALFEMAVAPVYFVAVGTIKWLSI